MEITFCEKEDISHVVKESHFWVAQFEKRSASRPDLRLNHKSSLLNHYLISMMKKFKRYVFLTFKKNSLPSFSHKDEISSFQ